MLMRRRLLGGGGAEPFYPVEIPYSCRFDAARSCYLSRTPGVAGNRQKWTWAGWVKLGGPPPSRLYLLTSVTDVSNYVHFYGINSKLYLSGAVGGIAFSIASDAVARDHANWYHVVLAVDTTQATDTNRVKLYINESLASTTSTYPAQNANLNVNAAAAHYVGRNDAGDAFLDGYLSDVYFLDGAALTPSTFGEFSTQNPNVWIPKTPTGLTYGTNGFHLDFANAADLGNDVSGNNNDWTSSGLASTDQMADTPTNNYPTFNPLDEVYTGTRTLTEGNLKAALSDESTRARTTAYLAGFAADAKLYFEVKQLSSAGLNVGLIGATSNFYDSQNGRTIIANGVSRTGLTTCTTNDIIGAAIDRGASSLTFYKNNTQIGTNDTWTPNALDCITVTGAAASSSALINFGATAFAYTPPTGFVALCSANMPDPEIVDSTKYFDAKLYTGTGAAQNITTFNFQPDLVWLKNRSQADSHMLIDSVRGATKRISTDLPNAEATDANGLTAFLSNGFTLGTGANGYNDSAENFVSWAWKEGADFGMDIVSYTGNGTARTIAHGLGAVPEMMIVKNRTTDVRYWTAYHEKMAATPAGSYLYLNTTDAVQTSSAFWNSTAPTSSVFSVGTDSFVNASANDYIAYLFRSVPGFSKFGSYVGNLSADGPFVYCGFRPRWVLIKRTGAGHNWSLFDAARNTYNPANLELFTNTADADTTAAARKIDILSNGFKVRQADSGINATETLIFAAFAEAPFKYANAR